MIIRGTPRLILREWKDTDCDLFREINADSKVMEFFPFRRSHAESDVALGNVNDMIRATGYGFYALELRETAEPIGFCGIAPANMEEVFPLGTMEIGWRLATRFWGSGYVTEAAKSLLTMAFDEKRLPEIVSFAVHDNHRSTAVMKRIGLVRDASRDFDHPRVPETHPHLKAHVTYALTRDQWKAMHRQVP
ncbi:GNAT family N-acetyltransferase [Agrobacterium larrymoorei]|uniref:GNAT family N-acetyltransferase n=1 Tax=Agrobacterium larrymoorei TaxID=160699 RepID=UPI0015744916|nr:GNAT family N-acetyltransferase [Agrobacterium larrymoorei]NTJ42738.1 GNAT family N-acetyltransferase [Agrobacterium larrymoorei]